MTHFANEEEASCSSQITETIEDLWRHLPLLAEHLDHDCHDLEAVVAQELHTLPPVPLIAFVGPSGAGKSTVFKLLTGIETATSDSIRPCSFVPCIGIPASLILDDALSLMPGMNLVERKSPEEAKDRDAPLNRLLYTASHLDGVIACDLPDIDGAVTDNHERARRVISLADRLVFTCSVHTYANKLAVEAFSDVLSMLADGDVVVLVTQFNTTSRDALLSASRHLKNDLVDRLLPHSQAFAPDRKDAFGTQVITRARTAQFFCSPRSPQPALEDILPLAEDGSMIQSFGLALGARNLSRSRAERRLGRLRTLAGRTSEVLEAFRHKSASVDQDLHRLKDLVEEALPERLAADTLSRFLPLARVLEITIEQAHKHKGNSLTRTLSWVGWPIRQLLQNIVGLLGRQDSSAFDKADLHLRKTATDRLLANPALISNQPTSLCERYDVDPATLTPHCDKFLNEPLHEFKNLATKWDNEVRREAADWCNDERNWVLVTLLLYAEPLVTPTIAVSAVGLVIWDLSVGGLGTALLALLKTVASTAAVLLGPKVSDFLMSGAQSDIRRRIQRLRRKWIHKYRRQVLRMLEASVLTPYVGRAIRKQAAARDSMHPTAEATDAAHKVLLSAIDRTTRCLESMGSHS